MKRGDPVKRIKLEQNTQKIVLLMFCFKNLFCFNIIPQNKPGVFWIIVVTDRYRFSSKGTHRYLTKRHHFYFNNNNN